MLYMNTYLQSFCNFVPLNIFNCLTVVPEFYNEKSNEKIESVTMNEDSITIRGNKTIINSNFIK